MSMETNSGRLLTREGSEVHEHQKRFPGICARIPLKETVMLDFRTTPVRKYISGVWFLRLMETKTSSHLYLKSGDDHTHFLNKQVEYYHDPYPTQKPVPLTRISQNPRYEEERRFMNE